MKTIPLSATVSVLLVTGMLCSCIPNDFPGDDTFADYSSGAGSILVTLNLSPPAGLLKSSSGVDASRINSLSVWAYTEGKLVADERFAVNDAEEVSLKLGKKRGYNLYLLANAEKCSAPASEESVSSFRYSLPDDGNWDGAVPMAATASIEELTSDTTLDIGLERLVTGITFSVRNRFLYGATVKSVRLRQAALDITPFSAGSTAVDVGDGDCASGEDIAALNAGNAVCFYALENCQGVLLPDNRDCWAKTPENIAGKSGSCTYIETEVEFSGEGGFSGTAVYRLYLGEDAVTDFNLRRNREVNLKLFASESGYEKASWKIDVSGLTRQETLPELDCNIPEYVGEWGYIDIPEELVDGDDITVSVSDNGSFSIADYLFVMGTDDCYTEELGNGCRLYHDYAADPKRLYIYSLDRQSDDTCFICLHYRNGDNIYAVPPPAYPSLAFGTDYVSVASVSLCEDGYERKSIPIRLTDSQSRTIDPQRFYIPGEVLEAANLYSGEAHQLFGRLYLDRLEYGYEYDGEISEAEYFKVTETARIDNMGYCLAGLKAGADAAVFSVWHSGFSDGEEGAIMSASVPVTVYRAFPNQRHLGVFENRQFAPGTDCSAAVAANLFDGDEGSGHATFRCGSIRRTNLGLNDSAWLQSGDEGCSFIDAAEDSLRFTAPPQDSGSLSDIFANGLYLIRGEVTNPLSGRVITGYYSVDITLYLPVVAQMEFGENGSGYFELGYDYAPCTPYSRHRDEEVWNTLFDRMRMYAGAPESTVHCLLQINNDSEISVWNNHYVCEDSGYAYSAGDWSGACAALSGLGSKFRNFKFYTEESGGQGYDEYLYVNDARNIRIRLVRYCDIVRSSSPATSGLDNCLLEAVRRDFDNY